METELNIVAIVQARVGSSRLPNKVMKSLGGRPMIEVLLHRLNRSKRVNGLCLAIPISSDNNKLADFVNGLGFSVFRGDEQDVLSRYYHAAIEHSATSVVRITGDCPFVDPEIVDAVIDKFIKFGADYASNIQPPTFPDGLDVEVFSFSALEKAFKDSVNKYDREHVTPWIRESNDFHRCNYSNDENLSHLRWTVDELDDLRVANAVIKHFSQNANFNWREILHLQKKQPGLFEANKNYKRNEGASVNSGQKLWRRAKKVIPGGNMLLSKRSEMFLPEKWPAYFKRSKGCRVWDLDDNEFIDMSLMSVGTNTLGYNHPEVDEAVKKSIDAGIMTTLNCPEEVELAERLIEMHPWSDMARFARTGGEANAIAIRIARAASGKDGVAICGYHGWHDWYLAANLEDNDSLSGHLLPGLAPKGVPASLNKSVFTFEYNQLEQLKKIIQTQNIGVIKMEVMRSDAPQNNFLQKVRKIASDHNIVLVFDECTSGFRETFGGLHKKFEVEPDMAVFGKALGNGYAITAVIGKRSVMEEAQKTFISSTFWTERIGPVAALKTLDVMEREKSWETITATGHEIRKIWNDLALKYKLKIRLNGLASLSGFSIESDSESIYKTIITQEMLKEGFLATTAFYASLSHREFEISAYQIALEKVFELIRECEAGRNPLEILEGPVCHSGFKRLN